MKSDDGIVRHVGRDPAIERPSLDSIFPEEKEVQEAQEAQEAQGAEGAEGAPCADFLDGTFKQITGVDDFYLKLEAKSEEFPLETSIKFNKLSIEKLRKYPSICPSFFVSNKEMIAFCGGVSLRFLIDNGYELSLEQFIPLMKDLYEMQKESLFMTDLKLENLVCEDPAKMVRLIDLDSIHDGVPGLYPPTTGETTGLAKSYMNAEKECLDNKNPELTQGKIKILHQVLSNMVSYYLLKSLIEATENKLIDPEEEYLFSSIGTEPNRFQQRLGSNSYARQKSIYELTQKWIKNNVKPEHQDMMRKFSIYPHFHKGIIDFSEVLIFHRSALRF